VGNTRAHICEVTNSVLGHEDIHSQVYYNTPRSLDLDLIKGEYLVLMIEDLFSDRFKLHNLPNI